MNLRFVQIPHSCNPHLLQVCNHLPKVWSLLLSCILLSIYSLFLLPLLQFGKVLVFVDLLSLLCFYTCSQQQLRCTVQSVILHVHTLTTSTVARKAIYNNLLCFNLFINSQLLLLYPQTHIQEQNFTLRRQLQYFFNIHY